MNGTKIDLYVGTRLAYSGESSKPLELGRESSADTGRVYTLQSLDGFDRVAIADKRYTRMSRRFLLINPLENGQVRVENLSKTNSVEVLAQEPLMPQEAREMTMPVVLETFDRRIEISRATEFDTVFLSMDQSLLPPGAEPGMTPVTIRGKFPLVSKISEEESQQLLQWLSAVARVLQSAVGSVDFYDRAAKEMVDLIGLDSGRVLILDENGNWSPVASFHSQPSITDSVGWVPISNLLRRVMQDKRTSWTRPAEMEGDTESTMGVLLAIAAPLLDREGDVIGALYGERRVDSECLGSAIDKLEAVLVETMAQGIAAGRARLEQESAASTAKIRFEQFFTTELSSHLANNPDLLTRHDREVSLLFCDIRRFSAISERLGPEVTMEWLSSVMGAMAECAAKYEGTLVDYIGDELMVMWGAPAEQPDHATRACQAVLEMARTRVEMEKQWLERIGQSTQLGFGINTGRAQVGNVGFERKFRYAPFGNTVNIASRVQGATKYLGADVIVTEATFRQLKIKPRARRLCSVCLINIEEPIVLYELCPDDLDSTQALCEEYEAALCHFESEQLPQAIHMLSEILRRHVSDGPTLSLLSRAVDRLLHPDGPFDPVFSLPGK